jgi:hypothetical protein
MAKSKITIQQFRKWNKAKQAEWLGNVSKRIRLPDAALPADLRAKRETSQRNRTEISPGSGVTFGDVAKQRKYTEGLTFGDGDRQLADRAANAVTGRQGSADWFKTYQQQVTGAADRAGAAVTAAGENNRGLFDSMNQLSREDTDRVQAAVRARAAELGQAAPDAGGLQGAQGAAATRAAMLGNAAITSNNEAAANAQFRNVGVNAAGLADNQNQANWDARDKAIAGDKTAYADKKGLWRQKFLDDAINSARKGVLEDKAFGLESESKATAAELAQAKLNEANRAARAREAISQQNANTSSYNSTKDPKPKPKVDKAQNAYKASIAQLFSANSADVNPAVLIKNSQQGKSRGATALINKLVGLGKGSVSYTVAQRAVYTWIATNGNPKSSNVHKAPRTWEQAVALWRKTQGK